MISMDKGYKTRDGRAVRVLCVDMNQELYPVVAIVKGPAGGEYTKTFTSYGIYSVDDGVGTHNDLIEVKPSVVFWLNARKNGDLFPYITEDLALKSATASSNYFFIARRVELPIEEQEK